MKRLIGALALAVLCLAGAASPQSARAESGVTRVVSAQGPYTDIAAALADARDGDTIEVRGGVYRGPLVVDKSVRLRGVGTPVIDGGGKGTVVTLSAPGIVFSGFDVRGSGVEPDLDDSGIVVGAARARIEDNRLHDVLFGVFIAKADDVVVRGNELTSKPQYETGRKGDSVRVWYSARARIERNHVHDARDIVLWYATDTIVEDNEIERGRFAVHLMYSNAAHILRNRIHNNSVGVFTMYSKDVLVRENVIRGQRGPSGSALGFKDAEDLTVDRNVIVDNRVGIFLDGTPFSPSGTSQIEGNIIAYNDIGAVLLPAVRGNVFGSNTFWENIEQVGIQGGGVLGPNAWRGNYWSDYGGFDADGDGNGESAYRSERFFDGMMDRQPGLRALLFSPVVQALEIAATTFPIVRPQPKLVDDRPRYTPAQVPLGAAAAPGAPLPIATAGAFLFTLGIIVGVLALPRGARSAAREGAPRARTGGVVNDAVVSQRVQVAAAGIAKRYGKARVLEGVSFEVHAGEALALWGANGAGKTTLIKAILGIIEFEGTILVGGHDVKRAGKAARRAVGYVPQETAFNDWRVRGTLEFYARLKHVRGGERITGLLQRMGLAEHADKTVGALSGGLKQRLALAIALLADPPLLLLDEPTSNLDKQARADYLAMLTALRGEGKTIVFTSHRFEEVESLADRVLVLERGAMAGIVTPEELRARWMPTVELTLWIGDAQRAEALALLQAQGLTAHLNGRGTIVCAVRPDEKMRPLETLAARGIRVANFEIERGRTWN